MKYVIYCIVQKGKYIFN